MKINVFADTICGWCFIGHTNLYNALKKFPNIKSPAKDDICYATTNRQMAVKKIAPLCEMMLVIGSNNSSNSVRLVEVAKKAGCRNSQLMHSEKDIPFKETNLKISNVRSAKTFGTPKY